MEPHRTNTALVLVDVQNDFLDRRELVPSLSDFISGANRLLRIANDAGWPIYEVRTIVRADGSNAMPHWQSGGLKCVENTAGSLPPDGLDLSGLSVDFIGKQFHNPFHQPHLLQALSSRDIKSLVISGVHTHACIRETAVAAYAYGFHVTVVEDAVASYDSAMADQTLTWLRGRIANILSTSELLKYASSNQRQSHSPTVTPAPVISAPRFIHKSPSDQTRVLFEVQASSEEYIDSHLRRICASQRDWESTPYSTRQRALALWADHLERDSAAIEQELINSLGKPRRDALAEIGYGLALIREMAVANLASESHEHSSIMQRAAGVILAITPWNNPFAIAVGKLAPALLFGNSVVWKPAVEAHLITELILKSLQNTGLSEFVVSITGSGEVAERLVRQSKVSAVTFTGSVEIGERLASLCGSLFKPFQGELGGNNAALVWEGADLEFAAQDLAKSMFSFAGQRCTAIRRVIVKQSLAADFEKLLISAVTSLRVGDPNDPATDCGPVLNSTRLNWLQSRFAECIEAGDCSSLVSAPISKQDLEFGSYFPPTILKIDLEASTGPSGIAWCDEWFAPVAFYTTCSTLEQAIARHNSVDHGLLGVIYSNNEADIKAFCETASVGMISINKARPSFSARGPFVGWGRSGFGAPEHGRWNREFYSRTQVVMTSSH